MMMVDFEYNGELLSEHGCVCGSVVSSTEDSQTLGNKLTLNTIQVRDKNLITSAKYEEVLTKTFDIIKNPCNMDDGYEFNEEEISALMLWLNRKEYFRFVPIYDDANYVDLCFWGTFTEINAVTIGGKVVGFTLTITTDSPYGYIDRREEQYSLDSEHTSFRIFNDSNELGYIYPEYMIITCLGDGDIYLSNNLDELSRKTVIKNCTTGEVLTIDCQHEIITSNKEHSTLMNDFNYNFPRLVRNYGETYNIFSFRSDEISGLDIKIKFNPIRKVGVIV